MAAGETGLAVTRRPKTSESRKSHEPLGREPGVCTQLPPWSGSRVLALALPGRKLAPRAY
jgi:hypothetical protein